MSDMAGLPPVFADSVEEEIYGYNLCQRKWKRGDLGAHSEQFCE